MISLPAYIISTYFVTSVFIGGRKLLLVCYYVALYICCIQVLLIHNYSSIIKKYFLQINKTVKYVLPKTATIVNNFSRNSLSSEDSPKLLKKIEELRKTYVHLKKVVFKFNVVFGYRTLLIFCVILLNICGSTNVFAVMLINAKQPEIGATVFASCWTISFMVSFSYLLRWSYWLLKETQYSFLLVIITK